MDAHFASQVAIMVRPAAATLGFTTPRDERPAQLPDLPPTGSVEAQQLGGMVTAPPRALRPTGSGLVVRNARCRDYWVGRRPGTSVYIEKPDEFPVHGIVTVYLPNEVVWLIRITDRNIWGTRSLDGWYEFSSVGMPLTGTSHIRTTQMYGYMIVATAHTKLISIDLNKQSYDEIEQAPRARFVTSFADRIVAANILDAGTGSSRVMWSKNADPFIWDPLEHESAGQEDLISSPSDTGDDITGLFAMRNTMVILRERSLWVASRNPVAIAPFRFEALSVGIGCDLPYSAVRVQDAVVWADYRTSAVWMYTPGQPPQKISDTIRNVLYDDLKNFSWAEGAYDPNENEYHLGLSVSEDENVIHKVWVYNFNTGQWTYDDGPEVITLGQSLEMTDLVFIDELTGDIDDQIVDLNDPLKPNPTGVIDDWSGPEVRGTGIFKGTADGNILHQSYDYGSDWNGEWFLYEYSAQNLGSFSRRRTLASVLVACEARAGGHANILLSIDNDLWFNEVTLNLDPVPREQVVRIGASPITGNNLYWKLTSFIPGFKMTYWAVKLREQVIEPRNTSP